MVTRRESIPRATTHWATTHWASTREGMLPREMLPREMLPLGERGTRLARGLAIPLVRERRVPGVGRGRGRVSLGR